MPNIADKRGGTVGHSFENCSHQTVALLVQHTGLRTLDMEFYVGHSQSGNPGILERNCEVLKALKDVRARDDVSLATRFPDCFKISSGGEVAQFQ